MTPKRAARSSRTSKKAVKTALVVSNEAFAALEIEVRFLRESNQRLQHERDTLLDRLMRVTTGFGMNQTMPDALETQRMQVQAAKEAVPKDTPMSMMQRYEEEISEQYRKDYGGVDRQAYIEDLLHAGELDHEERRAMQERAAVEAAKIKAEDVLG